MSRGREAMKKAAFARLRKKLYRRRRRQDRPMIAKTNWRFVWPRGTPLDQCTDIANGDLPRLGNNWIKVVDNQVTIDVGPNVNAVNVELIDINMNRVTSVCIFDGYHVLCTAYQSGNIVTDGFYGARKL